MGDLPQFLQLGCNQGPRKVEDNFFSLECKIELETCYRFDDFAQSSFLQLELHKHMEGSSGLTVSSEKRSKLHCKLRVRDGAEETETVVRRLVGGLIALRNSELEGETVAVSEADGRRRVIVEAEAKAC
ncbi:hypothetical protein PIB30_068618 [Stylosanthes scabra]|uniref:Uncharacterized protein n=1 Tax=Stylosanthes scabra TaxID=79078 RepID=A0ABU6QQ35_9FABA|nr:hypothetical protein [Stylosanthes scabra]